MKNERTKNMTHISKENPVLFATIIDILFASIFSGKFFEYSDKIFSIDVTISFLQLIKK